MLHLTWWQAFALLGCAAAAVAIGRFVGRWAHGALYRMALVARAPSDDRFVFRLRGPISASIGLAAWALLTRLLTVPQAIHDDCEAIARMGLLVVLAWAGARAIDVVTDNLALRSRRLAGHRVVRSAVPVARRVGKGVLVAIVAVMILAAMGFSIGPLVVVLAVAGFAATLCTHRAVENVIGAYTLVAEDAIGEGDFVRLESGAVGTVESIGLYVTRIRTPDHTLVVIPNRRLADAQLETQSRPTQSHAAVPPPPSSSFAERGAS